MAITKFLQNSVLSLALFAVVCFGFTACGGYQRLKENPAPNDIVYGNGGIAVQKGDYLYFTNGYKDIADIGESNEYGNVDLSAIYRVKLTDGRVTEKNIEYDEDGNKKVDNKQELKDIEIIVPKVAGFEYSNFYIFGDYIYYATPNHLKDREQKVMSNYLHFYRTKIDRSGKIDLIYSTEKENTEVSTTMYQIDNKVYQLIKDGQKVALNIFDGDVITTKVLSDKTTSVALPKYRNSSDIIANIDKKIYFTESMSNEDNPNIIGTYLKAFDLTTMTESTIFANEDTTYDIKGTSGDYLYYTKSIQSNPGQMPMIYCLSSGLNDETLVSSIPVTSDENAVSKISSYALVAAENAQSVVYFDGTNSYFKTANREAKMIANVDVVSKAVEVQGNILFYIADSTLKSVNYVQGDMSVNEIPEGDTPKADSVVNFDVSGDKIFYFVKYTDNYYMHYADYSINNEDGKKPYKHFIGKLQPADYLDAKKDE